MSLPDNGKNGIKTLAFRFKPEIHAQLSTIAQLRERTLQDEVMLAIGAHIEASKTDPALLSQVEAAQADIDREARDKRATIAALFETPADKSTPPAKPAKTTTPHAGAKP